MISRSRIGKRVHPVGNHTGWARARRQPDGCAKDERLFRLRQGVNLLPHDRMHIFLRHTDAHIRQRVARVGLPDIDDHGTRGVPSSAVMRCTAVTVRSTVFLSASALSPAHGIGVVVARPWSGVALTVIVMFMDMVTRFLSIT
jgi:hypothetical protein